MHVVVSHRLGKSAGFYFLGFEISICVQKNCSIIRPLTRLEMSVPIFLYTFISDSFNKNNLIFKKNFTLLLLVHTTCPVLANSVDRDQLASEEAN